MIVASSAAASAVATRAREAEALAIIGTGEQALAHIEAMSAVRGIRTVRIAGRTEARAEAFAAKARKSFPALRITACENAQAAVSNADII